MSEVKIKTTMQRVLKELSFTSMHLGKSQAVQDINHLLLLKPFN